MILAADLARLYGLQTKALNQAVQRNTSQFPRDFMFQLTSFMEHGAIMAANILHSPRAVAMSVYVVRAFIQQRDVLAANAGILQRLAEIDQKLLLLDTALRDIYLRLQPLLQPPPVPPKPKIGFHESSPRYGARRAPARRR